MADQEAPLTEDDIRAINTTVQAVLTPIQAYITQARSVAVDPRHFLQLPHQEDTLQNLIDAYAALYDQLPADLFHAQMNQLLAYRDQLVDLEQNTAQNGHIPPLVQVEIELGPKGCPRLAVPQDFVESLIADAGLTNEQIAEVIGESHQCSLSIMHLMRPLIVYIGCSRSTIQRRLKEWGIVRRDQTLSDEELEHVVDQVKTQLGPFCGERAIQGALQQLGVWAPRELVRSIIRTVDPQGVNDR